MEPRKGLSNDTMDSGTSNASSRDQEISTGFSATEPRHSVFHDDLEYAELDAQPNLWSHMNIPSSMPLDQRLGKMSGTNYGQDTTANVLPLENVYNNFQFSSTWGTTLPKWHEKPSDYEFEHSESPRVKLLDMKPGSSSEVSPPAEKKRRPSTGKLEYPGAAYNFNITEMGAIRPMGVQRGAQGSTVMGTRELHTMEQLLVQCAAALEVRDITQAQQTIFVINNIAAVDGDPNQRLLAHFLKALLMRASKFAPHLLLPGHEGVRTNKLKTVLELTNYIDVMPWYRFGFIAANGAILEAFEGKEKVHILDFNVSHCMQWPTLIEALAERSEGPPQVRLTVCVSKSPIPPLLEVPYDELVMRLAKFARSKNVPFEYALLVEDVENLDMARICVRKDEALAVNCLLRLHYVSEEGYGPGEQAQSCSPRDHVLRLIRNLNPAIVTLTEEDANLTSPKMVPRLRAAFNYLWIPFDALHTLLPKDSQQRHLYEDEVASKIQNLVAYEGRHRSERVETKDRWVQRMRRARFEMVAFSEDVVTENKLMLGEHSNCWGLRKDEEEDVLFLNWKGHTVSFATAWVPVD